MPQHELVLQPERDSAAAARRFVAALAERYGLVDIVEQVKLCTSELVTNAVLHARTELVVLVRATGNLMNVSVRDSSPVPLSVGSFEAGESLASGDEAHITGRGWVLVSAVANGCGVIEHDVGKTVWFELRSGVSPEGPPSALPTGAAPTRIEEAPPDWKTIRMVDVPARLMVASEQQLSDLVREAQLAVAGPAPALPGGRRTTALMQAISDRYAGQRGMGWSRAVQALSEGRDLITFEVPVPPEIGEDARVFLGLIEDAEELCRQGRLLVMPAPEELRFFRRWAVDEVLRQLDGAEPSPYPGPVTG